VGHQLPGEGQDLGSKAEHATSILVFAKIVEV